MADVNVNDSISVKDTDNSTIAFWKLDDDLSNTVILDSSGNNNNGTLSGGANTEDNTIIGKINAAQQVDGAVDYIDTGDPFQSTLQGSFSFCIWVKPDDGNPASHEMFFGVQDISGTTSAVWGRIRTGGQVEFAYRADDNNTVVRTKTSIFNDGQNDWINIIGVADATIRGLGGLKIYINGVLQEVNVTINGDTSGITFSDYTSSHNIIVGAFNNDGTPTAFFAGGIDNVRLFNKVLTQAEIDILYNAGNGLDYIPKPISVLLPKVFTSLNEIITIAENNSNIRITNSLLVESITITEGFDRVKYLSNRKTLNFLSTIHNNINLNSELPVPR